MYSSIDDLELVQFHKQIKSNVSFNLTEILDNNPLFIVESQGNIYKIIPLFNCEKIESDNIEDQVIEGNKCIICVYNEDTNIRFITNQQFSDLDVIYNKITKWGKTIFYGVVYDKDNLTPLLNAKVTIQLMQNNAVQERRVMETNGNGEFICPISINFNKINLSVTYEKVTHDYLIEGGS